MRIFILTAIMICLGASPVGAEVNPDDYIDSGWMMDSEQSGVEAGADQAEQQIEIEQPKKSGEEFYEQGHAALEVKRVDQAIALYEKAANAGYVDGYAAISGIYMYNFYGRENKLKSFKYAKMAADKGSPLGEYQLGSLYQHGRGTRKDLKTAIKWFEKSAASGNAEAYMALYPFYKWGDGVRKDLTKAKELLLKSIEGGSLNGMYLLALDYQSGQGGERDFAKAYKWFSLLAEKRDAYRSNLNRLKSKMTSDQIAEGKRLADEWRATHGQ